MQKIPDKNWVRGGVTQLRLKSSEEILSTIFIECFFYIIGLIGNIDYFIETGDPDGFK